MKIRMCVLTLLLASTAVAGEGKMPKCWIEKGGSNPGAIHWENYATQEWRRHSSRDSPRHEAMRVAERTEPICKGSLIGYYEGLVTVAVTTVTKTGKKSVEYQKFPYANLSKECKLTIYTELKTARKSAEHRTMDEKSKETE